MDIAIVQEAQQKIFALIEIEETTDKPKTILGDILGVLMGEHISFGRKRPLVADEHTILLVFVKSKVSHDNRNKYLREKVFKIKSNLLTANSVIGRIEIKNFGDDAELFALLPSVLDRAFKGGVVIMEIELNAIITCPQCGFAKPEQMLPDT